MSSVPKTVKPTLYRLKYHNETPTEGYIFLHDAMNIIGLRLSPRTWGLGAAWKYMPYKINGDSIQKIKFDPQRKKLILGKPVSPKQMRAYRRARDTFSNVRSELFNSIQSGKLKAYVAGSSNKPIQIPRGAPIWLDNIQLAFFSGRVLYSVSSIRLEPIVLLFKAVDVRRIHKPRSANLIRKRLVDTDLSNLIDILNTQSSKHNFNYSFAALWNLLSGKLSRHMGRDAFKDTIFDRLDRQGHPKGRSRPLNKDRDAFEAAKSEIVAWVVEELEARAAQYSQKKNAK